MARRLAKARGLRRRVLPIRVPGHAGRAMAEGALLPTEPGRGGARPSTSGSSTPCPAPDLSLVDAGARDLSLVHAGDVDLSFVHAGVADLSPVHAAIAAGMRRRRSPSRSHPSYQLWSCPGARRRRAGRRCPARPKLTGRRPARDRTDRSAPSAQQELTGQRSSTRQVDDDHVEVPGAVDALHAVELDVAGGARSADPGERAQGVEQVIASGTSATTWSARTTQTCRSGTSVIARRPWPGPWSRTMAGLGDADPGPGDHRVEPVQLDGGQPVVDDGVGTSKPRPGGTTTRAPSGSAASTVATRSASAHLSTTAR